MYTVFQQIDIEEHVQPGKGPQIRAFGVTQVRLFTPSIAGFPFSPLSTTWFLLLIVQKQERARS